MWLTTKLKKHAECAVCGARKPITDLEFFATRIYSTTSREHKDFKLNYCADNPHCAAEVKFIPYTEEVKWES